MMHHTVCDMLIICIRDGRRHLYPSNGMKNHQKRANQSETIMKTPKLPKASPVTPIEGKKGRKKKEFIFTLNLPRASVSPASHAAIIPKISSRLRYRFIHGRCACLSKSSCTSSNALWTGKKGEE